MNEIALDLEQIKKLIEVFNGFDWVNKFTFKKDENGIVSMSFDYLNENDVKVEISK